MPTPRAVGILPRPMRRFVFAGALAMGLFASACADPVDTEDAGPDAGLEDAAPRDAEPRDAEPRDAEPADAEPMDAEPMDAAVDAGVRGRRVRARGLAPAIGEASNGRRTVRGLIPSPSGGESSGPTRTVRGVTGVPRGN